MAKDDLQRDFENVMDILGNMFTRKQYDNVMENVTEEYKQEMLKWMTDGYSANENPMKRATQELWYSLYLEKKRLENRKCTLQYAQYKHIPYNYGNEINTVCTYHKDGKYLVCKASQMTNIEKNYIRDDVVIGQDKQKLDVNYYILRSHNENGLYICPNCAAEQTLNELLDGCDYCKTKFDISAYEDKVMSVLKSKSSYHTRELNNSGWVVGLVIAVVGVVMVLAGLMLALFTFGLSLFLIPFGAIATYFGFITCMKSNKNVENNTQWKYKLKDNNPDFSEEDFIGSLDCKLKAIHYASAQKDVAAFVKCDISSFIKSYQNTLSCEIGTIAFKDYRIEGEYQYLDIHRELEVLQDCNTHLQQGKGVVSMTLAKRISYKPKNDVSLYRCGGCGSSISLVEGGKCTYCGNEMDYAAYDWVVVDYKHISSI